MKSALRNSLKSLLRRFDIAVMRYSAWQKLVQYRNSAADDVELILALPGEHAAQLLRLLRKSTAQLRQDLFVLSEVRFKRNGFFVEFGATNGVDLSNSWLLEKEFGWNGILAEPARRWHAQLRANRSCHIETDCVWRDSTSVLTFKEALTGELSTLDSFSATDAHAAERKEGRTYKVKTISMLDMLDKYQAPRDIDFLSIDTEGSELDILSAFDFGRYRFKVIVCEHNFTPARESIHALLSANGYARKFTELSRFDDWYVRTDA